MKKRELRVSLGALAVLAGASPLWAVPIPVGSGASHAEVYIEFNEAAGYTFDVAFDGSMTGMGLMDIIEAQTELTTVRMYDGLLIDWITYDGHTAGGWDGGEGYWHYVTDDDGTGWTLYEGFGAATREVTDGDRDGWIFGRAVPEPSTALLVLSVAVPLTWPKRRQRGRGAQRVDGGGKSVRR